jgi:hypothetical protein
VYTWGHECPDQFSWGDHWLVGRAKRLRQRDFFSPLPCCWAGIAFTRVCITLVYVDIVYFDQQEGGG